MEYNLILSIKFPEGGMSVEVPEVRMRRDSEGEGKVRARCSVVLDGEFVVHGVKLVEGENGLFVSMPARRTSKGRYVEVAHPLTAEMREKIREAVERSYTAS
jgi:stage V sporulation protein G